MKHLRTVEERKDTLWQIALIMEFGRFYFGSWGKLIP